MTDPVVQVNLKKVDKAELEEVNALFEQLGLAAEPAADEHLGLADYLEPLMAFSTDSLRTMLDSVLAVAGGAAAAKLGALFNRVKDAKTETPDGRTLQGFIVRGEIDGSGFLIDDNVRNDPNAAASMLYFDVSTLPAGTLMIWDLESRSWRAHNINVG